MIAGLSEIRILSWSPILIGVVLLAVPGTRARIFAAETRPLPWWFSASVGATFLVTIPQLRGYFRQVPLSWKSGARSPHIDAYLHLSLAAQLAHRGPTTFPWVKSESLYYHWFSHAWVAQVSQASGAPLDATLFRFMPVLMPVVVILTIAVAAVRLTGRAWTGPVAGVLAILGGDLSVLGRLTPNTPIFPLSPSLALAMPMMVVVVLLLALRWQGKMRSGALILLPIVSLGAAGTKGSTLPLIVAGLGMAFVAMLIWERARTVPVLIDLVIVGVCMVFALVVIFAGSGEGLHVSINDASTETSTTNLLGLPVNKAQMAFVLGISFIGAISRAVGAAVLPFSRAGRRSPVAWTLIGGSLAGAGAIIVLAHPGWSQWYFVRTAEPLMALATVVGLVALFDAIKPSKRVRLIGLGVIGGIVMVAAGPMLLSPLTKGEYHKAAALLLIALVILLGIGVVGWIAGTDRTERLRLAGGAMILAILVGGCVIGWNSLTGAPPAKLKNVSLSYPLATSRDQINAARWIRDHSNINDVVMVNRHCTTPIAPDNCDNRRFVVSAFSERQVLVEAWTATPESAKLGPRGRENQTVNYWHPDLLALNDGFIAHPTAAAAAQLRKDGVKWIYVDHTAPYAATLEPYATLRYHNPGVDVYEFS